MEGSSQLESDLANVTESHVCKFPQVFPGFPRVSQVLQGPLAQHLQAELFQYCVQKCSRYALIGVIDNIQYAQYLTRCCTR